MNYLLHSHLFSRVNGIVADFPLMVAKIHKRFITKERTLTMTRECQSTSLKQCFQGTLS